MINNIRTIRSVVGEVERERERKKERKEKFK
jgi:hypothetical protein